MPHDSYLGISYLQDINEINVVAASKDILLYKDRINNHPQQWRSIKKIHSQKYYRFPAYSLAILIMNQSWIFNEHVSQIALATRNFNYDGVCMMAALKTVTSWSGAKVLHNQPVLLVARDKCEISLQRNCYLYYCTTYEKGSVGAAQEIPGGGLVCHATGDPAEVNNQGVLIGVTTLVNLVLPTLHNRVAIYSKWIEDTATALEINNLLLLFGVLLCRWYLFTSYL